MNSGANGNKRCFKRKKLIVPMFLVLTVLVVVGVSYALWQLTFTQTGTNVITTGCLKLTLTEETDAINLVDVTPISDEEGKSLEPFTFTLENVCTTETAYVVNLETLSTGDKILSDNYLRANLVSGDSELFIDNLLSNHINEEKVIEEATIAYKLHQGKLGSKERISFGLRLWMDEATLALDEVMNATWQGKITVTAQYIPLVDTKNMMVAMDKINSCNSSGGPGGTSYPNCVYSRGKYYFVLDKIEFQNEIIPYDNATEVVDFSEAQDESILGYYVKNGNMSQYNTESYDLYIQADGPIKLNYNAMKYLTSDYAYWGEYIPSDTVFEGLEYLDTSLVTDMSKIAHYNGMTVLNLSNFDTSNVTDMSSMFLGCINLITLDLGNFDTSKVTDMSGMFMQCYELSNLDLSGFDTSQVRDMSYMFYDCRKLTTTINITNPNVENYGSMFYNAATEEGAQITVNYTEETSDLVDRMIATKSANSNVVKGSLIS